MSTAINDNPYSGTKIRIHYEIYACLAGNWVCLDTDPNSRIGSTLVSEWPKSSHLTPDNDWDTYNNAWNKLFIPGTVSVYFHDVYWHIPTNCCQIKEWSEIIERYTPRRP